MAKLWTPQERKALRQIVESFGRSAEYNKPKIIYQFRQKYPNRTEEGVRAQLQLINRAKQYTMKLSDPLKLMYNPIDVAFTQPITKTDIIRHYRDMGLRGRVTLELGE